jgi:hypothetical protein
MILFFASNSRLVLQMGVSIDGCVAALDESHPWGSYEREDDAI